MATFTARYRGACAACDEPVEPGQECAYRDVPGEHRRREIVHVECPGPAPEVRRPVCPDCFTEVPMTGVCGVCA